MAAGSSPLTRGKRTDKSAYLNELRLIPAHAGKTLEMLLCVALTRAHPRSRGENRRARARMRLARGSSPLTRGKRRARRSCSARRRLIPAHAGKTSACETNTVGQRAHPRSRGENSAQCLLARRNLGSSPLTRGKQSGSCVIIEKLRLIPAHAGKTRQDLAARPDQRAHPRSRGENIVSGDQPRSGPGSSPLTRGKRD